MIDFLNDPQTNAGRAYRTAIILVIGLLLIGIINASNPQPTQPGNTQTTTTIIIEDNDTCVSLYCGGK